METALNDILQLFNSHSRKFAMGISVLLIVLMSLSVANTVLFVMETTNPPGATPIRAVNSLVAVVPTYKVSNLELFGKTEEAGTVPEAIDAPETKLNLELQGVFIAEDAKYSTAIVAEKNKSGELVQIGDRLPGNATLAAVFMDHVLIRRGSRMEKLMFSDSPFRVTTKVKNNRSQRASSGLSSSKRSDLESIRQRIRNRAETPVTRKDPSFRSSLLRYQERLQANPISTLNEVGITPVSSGESKGYRVGDNAQAIIKQAGLQAGDVILSVNGRPVGVAANDSALMQQVMASSRVRVEVQRGTRRFFLTVPVPK